MVLNDKSFRKARAKYCWRSIFKAIFVKAQTPEQERDYYNAFEWGKSGQFGFLLMLFALVVGLFVSSDEKKK